jgi:tryptophan-rich sensory protein
LKGVNSPQSPGQRLSPRLDAPSRDDRRAAWAAIVAATLIVAVLGALVSAGEAGPWYRSLAKAPGSPPQLAFAVVQPILYFLMAVGAGLTWNAAGAWREADDAMGVYFVQLIANLGWSVMFFQLHAPIAALFDVLAQWMLVMVMMASFARRSELAAQLQAPYLLWLTFTAYLNAWVVVAN